MQANQSTERVPGKVKVFVPGLDMAIHRTRQPGLLRPASAAAFGRQPAGHETERERLWLPRGRRTTFDHPGRRFADRIPRIAYGSAAVRIQIDAALNPGNSGGPAVSNGKLIGLVFSKYSAGDNIGYLLAAEEVKMLLKAIEKGPYTGKLQLYEEVATTENEALRAKFGLEKEAGLLIVQPFSDKPDYPIKHWDVLLKIGDQALDSQGNVKVLDELRLSYQYLVPKLARDGHVKLTVLRDRKTIEVEAPVRASIDLVMPPLLGKYPRYFVYGPMVFTQATQDIAVRIAASSIGVMYTTSYKSPLVPRLRIKSPSRAKRSWPSPPCSRTKRPKATRRRPSASSASVNGTKVRNLAHLVELLRDATGEFLVVELTGPIEPLVFRRAEVLQATEEILADEGIRKQYSDDLENVWHKGK